MTFDPSIINKSYALADGQGDSRRAYPYYVILHESGNANDANDPNALLHEVQYMKNNYNNAYTQFFVGYMDGKAQVYQIGKPGYVSWGALSANPYSPVQIEFARVYQSDQAKFKEAYKLYISLARYYANVYGIPLTLDGVGNGVKTHQWVTNNYGGDHVDPYLYFRSMGITANQLAHDLQYGVEEPEEKEDARNVITIDFVNGAGVNAYDIDGNYQDKSRELFIHGTKWLSNHIENISINGEQKPQAMYQVATNTYVPKAYTTLKGIVKINAIAGITARNSKGEEWQGSEKTFTDKSTWLTTDDALKEINGELYFQVSTDQFINTFYTWAGGNV